MIREPSLLLEVRATPKAPLNPGCPPIMRAPPDPRERRQFWEPVKDKNSPGPKLLQVKNNSPQMFRVRVHLKNVTIYINQ